MGHHPKSRPSPDVHQVPPRRPSPSQSRDSHDLAPQTSIMAFESLFSASDDLVWAEGFGGLLMAFWRPSLSSGRCGRLNPLPTLSRPSPCRLRGELQSKPPPSPGQLHPCRPLHYLRPSRQYYREFGALHRLPSHISKMVLSIVKIGPLSFPEQPSMIAPPAEPPKMLPWRRWKADRDGERGQA